MSARNTSAATPGVLDLLPCPFCGGDDLNHITEKLHRHYVSCPTCWAIGPATTEREAAIGAWNERAAQPGAVGEAQQVNAALLQALREISDLPAHPMRKKAKEIADKALILFGGAQ